jgi:hypothetical protein
VEVLDRGGEPVVGQRVAFVVEPAVAGASVTPEARTDEQGVAQAEWVLGTVLGSQSVIASVVGADELTATFDAVAGPAEADRIEYLSGDAQTAPIGSALRDPLIVRVVDQFGNPVAGVTVNWEVESGTANPPSSVTLENGLAETSWVLGSSIGTQTARATSNDLEGSPITFTATAGPGTADRLLLVSGNNQRGEPGSELDDPLVVRLIDADGNGIPNRAVSWVVGAGGGSVSATTSTTNDNGEAETRWTLGRGMGVNTLNAVVSGLNVVGFTAQAERDGGGGGGPTPTRLEFLVQPSDAEEDRNIVPAVRVAVLDQNGALVTTGSFEIKLELIGDDNGDLEGRDEEDTFLGVATFDDIEVDREGEYRLRATSDGLLSAESSEFDVRDRNDGGDD